MDNYDVRNEVTDKYTLRGRVFNKMRENILNGVYKHNEALRELKISDELGVSRTPVREAIRQLELEGLVTIIPNKGAVVSSIGAKDIEDIYAIRSEVEGLAAKWAAMRMKKEHIDALEEMIFLSKFHLEKGHIEQLYEIDTKFHQMLYDLSGSRIMGHLLTDFHHYVQRVRFASLSSYERAAKSVEEHEAILRAIVAKDFEEVERLTNEHVRNTKQNLMDKNLPEQLNLEK